MSDALQRAVLHSFRLESGKFPPPTSTLLGKSPKIVKESARCRIKNMSSHARIAQRLVCENGPRTVRGRDNEL